MRRVGVTRRRRERLLPGPVLRDVSSARVEVRRGGSPPGRALKGKTSECRRGRSGSWDQLARRLKPIFGPRGPQWVRGRPKPPPPRCRNEVHSSYWSGERISRTGRPRQHAGACGSREGQSCIPRMGSPRRRGRQLSPRGGTVRSGGPGVRDRFLAEANLPHELADALEALCGFAFPPSRAEGVLWRWRHP